MGFQCDPPDTATAELEDELTGVEEDWTPDEPELEAVVLVEVVLAVPVVAVAPGLVLALTNPRTATPPTAEKAAAAVSRLRSRKAESRALILASSFL
ncbi:MAG TPA: hypothetical protein VET26_03580 [Candidatus Sulfotelmatobacter sp.]|nr:hypothetical protein [Candidatus Sulfotelmatobacter sp.]